MNANSSKGGVDSHVIFTNDHVISPTLSYDSYTCRMRSMNAPLELVDLGDHS